MKPFQQRVFLAALAACAVLAACNSGSIPGSLSAQTPSLGAGDRAFSHPMAAATIPPCKLFSSLPGNYIVITAAGNVKGKKFSGITNKSPWYEMSYVSASASPPPYPTPSPSTAEYVYYGAYSIKKHKTQGCAYLITTKSGKPLPNLTYNGSAFGSPQFKTPSTASSQPVSYGYFGSTVLGLGPHGGSGKIALTTYTGAAYDTGIVKFTGRVLLLP